MLKLKWNENLFVHSCPHQKIYKNFELHNPHERNRLSTYPCEKLKFTQVRHGFTVGLVFSL